MKTATVTPPHVLRQRAAQEVKEAAENHAYWNRQSHIRQNKDAAAQAAALARVWKTTLTARQDKLEAFSALTTDS